MNTYTKLTAYLPILEADNFGKWIVDNESKGTVDNPIQMPYVTYSRMARHFIDDVYTFADEHQEYGLYRYNDILFENGIEWDNASMREVDTSALDGKCITALLMGAIRADRFQRERYYTFLKQAQLQNGLIVLKRSMKKRVLTETNSQGSFFILL